MPLPFEFIVVGVPVSANARGWAKEMWKGQVQDAAMPRWEPNSPITDELQATLIYFFKNGSVDVDNMIKPTLDALNGMIYADDAQVSQVLARKSELIRGIVVAGATDELVEALTRQTDFLFVKIDGPPDHSVLP